MFSCEIALILQVKFIMRELDMPRSAAERALYRYNGDLQKTLDEIIAGRFYPMVRLMEPPKPGA